MPIADTVDVIAFSPMCNDFASDAAEVAPSIAAINSKTVTTAWMIMSTNNARNRLPSPASS